MNIHHIIDMAKRDFHKPSVQTIQVTSRVMREHIIRWGHTRTLRLLAKNGLWLASNLEKDTTLIKRLDYENDGYSFKVDDTWRALWAKSLLNNTYSIVDISE